MTVDAVLAPPRPVDPVGFVRVVVVEHRPVYRAGVRAALQNDPALRVIAEARTAAEAPAMVATLRPDVVMVGLQTGGVQLCRVLAARFPACRAVIVGAPDDHHVAGAVQAGARGYLRATAHAAQYVAAVRAVARGRMAFDPHALPTVRAAVERGEHDRLTPRELDVLRLAGHGMSTAEIARELGLSGTTVKSYLGNLMRKLGVTRRAGAVYVGRARGLI